MFSPCSVEANANASTELHAVRGCCEQTKALRLLILRTNGTADVQEPWPEPMPVRRFVLRAVTR